MKAFLLSAILSTVICVSVSASAASWYVDGSVSSSGDGTSWETALKTIQEGIDASSDSDTVIVAEGTYFENIQFSGKNILLTSTDPLDPPVVASTIIDGNQAGSVVTFSGTETEACILSGFTIRNGETDGYGGGISGGAYPTYTHATIQNNTITGNSAGEYGGGLYECNGTIQNNTIAGNSAQGEGGGLWSCGGTTQNNRITGNSAGQYGGGLDGCYGTIQNNTIAGNSAQGEGGGLWYCGGTIQNNTITGNSAGEHGGGLDWCDGTIRNCIIWRNTAPTGAQLDESSIPNFSCIQGWSGGGQGNIRPKDPLFVNAAGGDYHLKAGSPCIDAGVNCYWFVWPERDMDGNCRLFGERVDMGCYEFGGSIDSDGDLLSDADESAAGTDPIRDDSDGDGLRDGLEVLRGSDPLQPTAPGILNVPSDFGTIQEALCVSMAGDEIIVAPGTYPENLQFGGPDIILRSSDPGDASVVASTILDGGGVGPVVSFTGGESEACMLAGFMIRNGHWDLGGGVNGNWTLATVQHNTITDNTAERGGGLSACNGTIQNNRITGNSAHGEGGGLWYCDGTIENNTITGNTADSGGGLAASDGRIQNNTITGNSATGSGGGLYYCNGTIQNNTITGNSADSGGGLSGCPGTVRNCIIWGNTAPTGPQLYDSSVPTYSCIQGWSGGGEGNTTSEPRFLDLNAGDYRLQEGSPCIDAGYNHPSLPPTDIVGMHRIMFAGNSLTVDMGAYEFTINRLEPIPGRALLTWSSLAGETYSIFYTDDLLNWHTAINSFPSFGDTTTCWVDDGSLTGIAPSLVPRRFYRLLENPQ